MKKNRRSFKEEYAHSKELFGWWKGLWDALGERFEGNALYEFWWWHIWSNVSQFFKNIKISIVGIKYKFQRLLHGISEDDIYEMNEYMLEKFVKESKNLLWNPNRTKLLEFKGGKESFIEENSETLCLLYITHDGRKQLLKNFPDYKKSDRRLLPFKVLVRNFFFDPGADKYTPGELEFYNDPKIDAMYSEYIDCEEETDRIRYGAFRRVLEAIKEDKNVHFSVHCHKMFLYGLQKLCEQEYGGKHYPVTAAEERKKKDKDFRCEVHNKQFFHLTQDYMRAVESGKYSRADDKLIKLLDSYMEDLWT